MAGSIAVPFVQLKGKCIFLVDVEQQCQDRIAGVVMDTRDIQDVGIGHVVATLRKNQIVCDEEDVV